MLEIRNVIVTTNVQNDTKVYKVELAHVRVEVPTIEEVSLGQLKAKVLEEINKDG